MLEDQKHDHRTKTGLYDTVSETLDNLPETLWSDKDASPNNRFLKLLNLRQPGQSETLGSVMQQDYLKPDLVGGPGQEENFDRAWLGAENINHAVQIMMKKKDFGFLGTYAPVLGQTQSILTNFFEKPKKKAYGVVWNTDNAQGRHWVVALFFPSQKRFEFFDSQGNKPTHDVGCQMKVVKQEIAKAYGFSNLQWTHPPFKGTKHQKGGYQCGMYVIWYMEQRIIKRKSYEAIQSQIVDDAEVCQKRYEHFRKPEAQTIQYAKQAHAEAQAMFDAEKKAKKKKPQKKLHGKELIELD